MERQAEPKPREELSPEARTHDMTNEPAQPDVSITDVGTMSLEAVQVELQRYKHHGGGSDCDRRVHGQARRAYRDRGAIIIWWDESEQDAANDNPDDLTHTIGEIVISPRAHPNVNGVPFASQVFLTHSSDLRTMQAIFHVTRPFFLGDAIHANDLSSLFAEGAIPRDDEDDDFDRR